MKRFFDVVAALTILALLSPLLILVAVVLRLTGEREVLYWQMRIGHRGKPFMICKFATMLKNSPNLPGAEITLVGDPRVLPLGSFLRRTKINELPQLFNIITGEMTFVGPRPLMEVSFRQFPTEVADRLAMSVPGITGISSLIFRHEDRIVTAAGGDPKRFYKEVIFPYKALLETWYIDNRSMWVDLTVLIITAWSLFGEVDRPLRYCFPTLPLPPEQLPKLKQRPEHTFHSRETL